MASGIMMLPIIYADNERFSCAEMERELKRIQRACAELTNRAVNFAIEWQARKSIADSNVRFKDIYGTCMGGYAAKKLRDKHSFLLDGRKYNDVIAAGTIDKVCNDAFSNSLITMENEEVMNWPIISADATVPIVFKKRQVRFNRVGQDFTVKISAFSSNYNRAHGMENGGLLFRIGETDDYERMIINRILTGELRVVDGSQISCNKEGWNLELRIGYRTYDELLDDDGEFENVIRHVVF